ncbi:MAG: helix-turn-helix domain-containing protein [Acidimicrobiales bacterium]
MTTSIRSKPLLTLDEVAIVLSISRAAIYRSVKRGDLPLPVIKINGRMRIPRLAVERLLAGEVEPSSTPVAQPTEATPALPCSICGRTPEPGAPDRILPT